MTERPQNTNCTTIVVDTEGSRDVDEGVANGIVSMIASARDVEYDEERGAYVVGEPKV